MRRQQITMKAGFDLALIFSSSQIPSCGVKARRKSFFFGVEQSEGFAVKKERKCYHKLFNGNKTVSRKPAETKGHRSKSTKEK